MERINLTIDDDRKAEWKDYADEEFGGNLSHLIRRSVSREIAGRGTEDANEETLAAIIEKIDSLGDSIDLLHDRVERVEDESRADPKIERLTHDIFDLLPDEKPGTEAWRSQRDAINNQLQAVEGGTESKDVAIAWEGTIEQLSVVLDEPKLSVQEAIDKLLRETKLIGEAESGDERRYYRRVTRRE